MGVTGTGMGERRANEVISEYLFAYVIKDIPND